jgi:MSHA biogenesis protein MshN
VLTGIWLLLKSHRIHKPAHANPIVLSPQSAAAPIMYTTLTATPILPAAPAMMRESSATASLSLHTDTHLFANPPTTMPNHDTGGTETSSTPARATSKPPATVKPNPAAVSIQTEPFTPTQIADASYNQAIDLAQQNKMDAAITLLRNTLESQPQNVKIRMALASFLINNKQEIDAENVLQEGLKHNPEQIEEAMLLARLQIEHNNLNDSIATLQHSLPYAANQADYHAMLAALLQREGNNEAAIEHYVIALRQNPQSGVWWMGLGIAEHADNHPEAAREAYMKAKATNSLSADLQTFVDQQLQQH